MPRRRRAVAFALAAPLSRRTVLGAVFALVVACSSTSEEADGGSPPPAPKDVRIACEERAAWPKKDDITCIRCTASAVTPPCECDPGSEDGFCLSQNQKRVGEADCTADLRACEDGCKGDCACIDGCYAGHDRCRAAASALAGCISVRCDAICRGS